MKNATYYTMEITVIVNHFLNKFSKVERGDKMDAIHITFLKNPYVDMYSLNWNADFFRSQIFRFDCIVTTKYHSGHEKIK